MNYRAQELSFLIKLLSVFQFDLPIEFHDINNTLVQFFIEIDKQMHNYKEAIVLLRKYIQFPEDVEQQEILKNSRRALE